ncbi:MAG: hypothetical protein IE919_02785 [Thioclava sp.]|nr:hypothetical protein [Thioclava sp.]MBD3802147.1 hypothetical protein [Thioclava sp.]
MVVLLEKIRFGFALLELAPAGPDRDAIAAEMETRTLRAWARAWRLSGHSTRLNSRDRLREPCAKD